MTKPPPSTSTSPARNALGLDLDSMARAPSLQPGSADEERMRRYNTANHAPESRLKGFRGADASKCASSVKCLPATCSPSRQVVRNAQSNQAHVTVKCTITPLDWPQPNSSSVAYSSLATVTDIPTGHGASHVSTKSVGSASVSAQSECDHVTDNLGNRTARSKLAVPRVPTLERMEYASTSSNHPSSPSSTRTFSSGSVPSSSSPPTRPLPVTRANSAFQRARSDTCAIVSQPHTDASHALRSKGHPVPIASIKENTAMIVRSTQRLEALSRSVRNREDFTNADARRNIALREMATANGASAETATGDAVDVMKSSSSRATGGKEPTPHHRSAPLEKTASRPHAHAEEFTVSTGVVPATSTTTPSKQVGSVTDFPRRAAVVPSSKDSSKSAASAQGTSRASDRKTSTEQHISVKTSRPRAATVGSAHNSVRDRKITPVPSQTKTGGSSASSTGASSHKGMESTPAAKIHVERGIQAQEARCLPQQSDATNGHSPRRREASMTGSHSPRKSHQEHPIPEEALSLRSDLPPSSTVRPVRSTTHSARAVLNSKSTPSLKSEARSFVAESPSSVDSRDGDLHVAAKSKDTTRTRSSEDKVAKVQAAPNAQRQLLKPSTTTSGSTGGEKDATKATSANPVMKKATLPSSHSSPVKKGPSMTSKSDKAPTPKIASTTPRMVAQAGNSSAAHAHLPNRALAESSTARSQAPPAPKPAVKSPRVEKVKALDIAKFTHSAAPAQQIPPQTAERTAAPSQPEEVNVKALSRARSASSSSKPSTVQQATPSERSSVVSYATMIVDPSTPQRPASPARAASGKTRDVTTPLATFFAESVVGSSASAIGSDDDCESPFGRTKPLPDLLSLVSSKIGPLNMLQNASFSQVEFMKPSLVERTSLSSTKGSIVSKKASVSASSHAGTVAVINLKDVGMAAAVGSSSEESLADPSIPAAPVRLTTFPNASDSTLPSSRVPSRASHARGESASSAEDPPLAPTRMSRGMEVPVEAPPPYTLRQSFMYHVEKEPEMVREIRCLHDEKFPRRPRESVDRRVAAIARQLREEAEEEHREMMRAIRAETNREDNNAITKGENSNILTKALKGLVKLKKPNVFWSSPPDVGTSGSGKTRQ